MAIALSSGDRRLPGHIRTDRYLTVVPRAIGHNDAFLTRKTR